MTLANTLQRGMSDEEMLKSFEAGPQGITNLGLSPHNITKPTAVEKFKQAQVSDIGNEGVSVTTEPAAKRTQGGFATFKQGLTPKNKVGGKGLGFGLTAGKMPSFEDLATVISNLGAFVGGLARTNRAKGLTPGVEVTSKENLGLSRKDEAGILIKELDVFDTSDERKTEIRKRLKQIVSGGSGVEGDTDSDLAEIQKLLAQS